MRSRREREIAAKRVGTFRTANGFLHLHTLSLCTSLRLRALLMFRYGFRRRGPWIPGIVDQAIHPSFVRGQLCILAGWDHWFGYYLMADDAESDRFLSTFREKHCGEDPPAAA